MSNTLGRLFDTIGGLPMHPIAVHLMIVGIPVLALLVIYRLGMRRRGGWAKLAVAAAFLTGYALVVRKTGEALASRIGYEPILATNHILYANIATVAAGLMFLGVLTLHWIDNNRRRRGPFWLRGLVVALTMVVSAGSIAAVVLAGHSGGTAAWQYIVDSTKYGDHQEP